jgi:hypothetical protein
MYAPDAAAATTVSTAAPATTADLGDGQRVLDGTSEEGWTGVGWLVSRRVRVTCL